jgi:MOSC domain-containing protein YiiM
MGSIERIWVKRAHEGPMDAVDVAELQADHGIVGNADTGGARQVCVLSADQWAVATAALGELDPALRRANVMVRGVDLARSRGKVLRLGSVRLAIGGETEPCRLMEVQHAGLQEALRPDWGGGAYGRVLDDGVVRVGDLATWVE